MLTKQLRAGVIRFREESARYAYYSGGDPGGKQLAQCKRALAYLRRRARRKANRPTRPLTHTPVQDGGDNEWSINSGPGGPEESRHGKVDQGE